MVAFIDVKGHRESVVGLKGNQMASPLTSFSLSDPGKYFLYLCLAPNFRFLLSSWTLYPQKPCQPQLSNATAVFAETHSLSHKTCSHIHSQLFSQMPLHAWTCSLTHEQTHLLVHISISAHIHTHVHLHTHINTHSMGTCWRALRYTDINPLIHSCHK